MDLKKSKYVSTRMKGSRKKKRGGLYPKQGQSELLLLAPSPSTDVVPPSSPSDGVSQKKGPGSRHERPYKGLGLEVNQRKFMVRRNRTQLLIS